MKFYIKICNIFLFKSTSCRILKFLRFTHIKFLFIILKYINNLWACNCTVYHTYLLENFRSLKLAYCLASSNIPNIFKYLSYCPLDRSKKSIYASSKHIVCLHWMSWTPISCNHIDGPFYQSIHQTWSESHPNSIHKAGVQCF